MAEYQNEREIILEVLMEVLEEGKPSHLVLRQALDKYDWMERNRKALISKVSLGTIDHLYRIDAVLDAYSNTPVKKMKPLIRSLLRMSTYQILYMDKIPDAAVCNEAVKIAKAHSFVKLSGFVNGVLRSIGRGKAEGTLKMKSSMSPWALQYSMPQWIIDCIVDAYGSGQTETILKGLTEHTDGENSLSVTALFTKYSKEEIEQAFLKDQIDVVLDADCDRSYQLKGTLNSPATMTVLKEGMGIIQDKSSCLCAMAVAPKKGDIVIDACAAPGGKSIVIADLLGGTGMVYSCDISEYKCDLLRENISRVGLNNIRVLQNDALQRNEKWIGKADIVLADLPCSGLGIIGKKSDIRYHMTPEKQKEIVMLQRQMLTVLEQYVKPGGKLIYSTCTIHPAENIENRNWFLEQFDYHAIAVPDTIPEKYWKDTGKDGYIQFLPGIDDTDGFFFACFQKEEKEL